MAQAVQRRRGTTAQHAAFTGLAGELTVDTTKKVVVVHDGATPGGFPVAAESHSHGIATANVAGFLPPAGTDIGKALLTTGTGWAVSSFSAPPTIVSGDALKSVFVNSAGAALEYVTAGTARARFGAAPVDALAALNLVRNPSGAVSRINGTGSVATAADVDSKTGPDLWTLAQNGTMRATVQQVTDAPLGYATSVKVTITTAMGSLAAGSFLTIGVPVQGVDAARLQFGLASAKTATIGIWVKASVAGNYSVALRNPALTRSFVGQVAIAATSTWEYKVIPVTAQTGGVWPTDTGTGFTIDLALAAGSNFVGSQGWNSANNLIASGQINMAATNGATMQVAGLSIIAGDDVFVSADAWRSQRPLAHDIVLCAANDVVIRGDVSQGLTAGQEKQGRNNIGLHTGAVIQSVRASYSGGTDLTAYAAIGNTKPTSSQGTQIMTATITPKRSDSTIRVTFRGSISASGNIWAWAALFKDSDANAIGSDYVTIAGAGWQQNISISVDVVPGSTSPITFKMRAGPDRTSTSVVFSANSGVSPLGNGTCLATLTVEELAP